MENAETARSLLLSSVSQTVCCVFHFSTLLPFLSHRCKTTDLIFGICKTRPDDRSFWP